MFKYDATSVQVTRVLVVIVLMTMKKNKKTKLSHLTKDLNGNYHYGFNIEHAKPVLVKDLQVNSLLGEYQLPLSMLWEGKGFLQASMYM